MCLYMDVSGMIKVFLTASNVGYFAKSSEVKKAFCEALGLP